MTLHCSQVKIQVATKPASGAYFPDDADIERILVERSDIRQQGVGIVLGLVEKGRRRVFGLVASVKTAPARLTVTGCSNLDR
jgi:hypothetical protein